VSGLPGADLVERGVADLRRRNASVEALLVSIGASRLSSLGYDVTGAFDDPEKRLYARLATDGENAAHSRYNALVRRLVSFERAAECVR